MGAPDAMQAFYQSLRSRLPRIAKSTSSEVEISMGVRGEFTVTAKWPATRLASEGSHAIFFSRSRVLGRSAAGFPHQQRPVKKPCRVADDIVREILTARGV